MRNRSLRIKRALVLTTAALMLSRSGWAEDSAASAGALGRLRTQVVQGTPVAEVAASETQPAEGPHEGIKVHGHWTIEVRNPDGTLVTHRQFENALAGSAPFLFVLGRAATIGLWTVYLQNLSLTQPCQSGSTPIVCVSAEAADPTIQPNWFHTLTVTPQLLPNQLTLSGTVTVQNTDQITNVNTYVGVCAPTVAPANCATNGLSPYLNLFGGTGATIAPIPVSVGQIVQFTVVLSLS